MVCSAMYARTHITSSVEPSVHLARNANDWTRGQRKHTIPSEVEEEEKNEEGEDEGEKEEEEEEEQEKEEEQEERERSRRKRRMKMTAGITKEKQQSLDHLGNWWPNLQPFPGFYEDLCNFAGNEWRLLCWPPLGAGLEHAVLSLIGFFL